MKTEVTAPATKAKLDFAMDPASVRRTILEAGYRSKHCHLPSNFCVVEILLALYGGVLKVDPKNPKWEGRDIFILSKGHAAEALYAVLGHAGFFDPRLFIDTYCHYGSLFGCHPDKNKVPGVEASTGSLGHGFPFGVGIAMSFKIKAQPNRVFALIGDGESNEGSIWEAAMIAKAQKLDNFVAVLDLNNSQTRCLPLENPAGKWKAFGFNTMEVDGHSVSEVKSAFEKLSDLKNGAPGIVIAHTVKGKGTSITSGGDNHFAWHHRTPTAQEYEALLKELS